MDHSVHWLPVICVLIDIGYSVYPVYTVSQKSISDICSCNSRKHYRILIMFGTRDTEEVSNQ